MKLITQPEDSSLCGQACVAMVAGISLKQAVEVIGHESSTTTRELVKALRERGVDCDNRLRRVGRIKPVLPKRAIIVIHRPKELQNGRREKWHWMLTWDGVIMDPGNRWPEGYPNWRITSYLEIR
jgi:hypothetical protein